MGQVAFDTQEFVETLENAGLPKEQARAISIAVRKSHEVADVAAKADIVEVNRNIADVRKDLSAEIAEARKDTAARFEKVDIQIADVRKDMAAQFEKTDAKIAEVRKDLSAEMNLRFERTEAQISDARKEAAAQADRTDAQITLLRKDVEGISSWLLIRMGGTMAAIVGIATAIIKLL